MQHLNPIQMIFYMKDRILENIDYVSPQSTSNNTNFSIKSYISSFLSTDFYFSNSEYTFSNESSSAYQEQDVVITRLGINYNNNKIIEKLGLQLIIHQEMVHLRIINMD